MIKFIRDLSIRKKLLAIQVFSSGLGLILAALIIFVFEVAEFKKNALEDLSAMADLVGNRSSAALVFDDPELAQENLNALRQLPMLHSACIYDKDGHVFTMLKLAQHHQKQACGNELTTVDSYYEGVFLYVYKPIILDSEKVGTVYVHAGLEKTFLRKIKFIGVLVLVLFMTTIVIFLITKPLLKLITHPINKLLATVNSITQDQDYSRRAIKSSNDELGDLVDGFNKMVITVDQQNHSLMVAKDHYLALYDNNPTMVFNLSLNGLILSVNHFGAKQLGLSSEVLKKRSIFDFSHLDDKEELKALLDNCISSPNNVYKQELRMVCRDTEIIWVRETARLIVDENQQYHFLLVCEDVTETRVLNEKIAYQASHDALTGLQNRIEFDLLVKRALITINNGNTEHALCYLDLDQFKVVNDTSGHLAGDELLRQLSQMLKGHIRSGDMLARLGGDEFGILMMNCSLDEASYACDKLRDSIKNFQFAWEDRSFFIGVSIGITAINRSTGNAVDALKEADTACYEAKERGRNRIHVFRLDDEVIASRQGEMRWVEKIRQGIDNNNFVLYGQLIVPIRKQEAGLHFETLVRYVDDEGKIIPPGAFLAAAERYNMAVSLDKWVISHLFEWLASNMNRLDKLSMCSVNLSGLSLSDERMLAFIDQTFEQYAIPNDKICFEITETAAIANLTYATKFINQLREKGCSFSLDDFGSGLSSFAYLKNLPVDYLKIDGIFVKDIIEDKVDLAMVKSINEVGHVMGKKTIAEFVENQQIFDELKRLGVDYAQGYHIAKPVPLDQLEW